MSEFASCQLQAIGSTCPARLPLGDALRRFQEEATWGVCDTGRYRCSFFTWGSGPPLVFIPGLADDARSFVLLAAHLAMQFRCIAYDLPNGRHDAARLSRYAHGALVEDFFALLDHLELAQSYVLGSSFGGTIALAALHAQPQRLPRAVVQGAFARRPLAPAEVLLARLARYWPGSMRLLPFRGAILRRNHHAPFVSLPADVWDYFLARSNDAPMAAVAHRALLLHRADLRALLPEIRQPVLVVCGDRDPLVDSGCADALMAGLPNAGRVDLVNCGHSPLFTHPETLAAVARRFLTPVASPG
jgi:pimeloyl-ACP methyl ester carboxylesterase